MPHEAESEERPSYSKRDLEDVFGKLRTLIKFSAKLSKENAFGLHSIVGGKFGELWVATRLWKHKPLIGDRRDRGVGFGVKRPRSADIVLPITKKKIEVKWGMVQSDKKNEGRYWGWKIGKKCAFHYCVLLAADENGNHRVFVLTKEEAKSLPPRMSMGSRFRFVEIPEEFRNAERFYSQRRLQRNIEPCIIERTLTEHTRFFERRWKELRDHGELSKKMTQPTTSLRQSSRSAAPRRTSIHHEGSSAIPSRQP